MQIELKDLGLFDNLIDGGVKHMNSLAEDLHFLLL